MDALCAKRASFALPGENAVGHAHQGLKTLATTVRPPGGRSKNRSLGLGARMKTPRLIWARKNRFLTGAALFWRTSGLQDEPAEVGVGGDVGEAGVDVVGVDAEGFAGSGGGVEADVFHDFFNDGV